MQAPLSLGRMAMASVAAIAALVAVIAAVVAAIPRNISIRAADAGNPLALCRASGQADTLEALAACMARFVVPEGAIPTDQWHDPALGYVPSPQQARDLQSVSRGMAGAADAAGCAAVPLPDSLKAVALFSRLPAHARSVLLSTKHRAATAAASACLPGGGYPASDPSHNAGDAFNQLAFGLLSREEEELGGCCGGLGGGGAAGGSTATGGASGAGGRGGEGFGADGGGGGGGCGGGTGGRAVFLQLHGKADASCPNSTVFASGGLGRGATAFYGRNDTAVARLAASLAAAAAAEAEAAGVTGGGAAASGSILVGSAMVVGGVGGGAGFGALGNVGLGGVGGGWAIRLPPEDPGCVLAATRNVFGRVVNGVATDEACDRGAEEGGGGAGPGGAAGACFGAFAHAEQAARARDPASWGVWEAALAAALREE
ncbi:hypothetical protein GPECTOR_782g962 [Gonium pectorale]|uniref:Uncharacterized protein n=1 Tax=Gonium pectorale TaxID=33097 RepID=A0A150FU19_GONPE|nr:hypothetical protein GPECTOR_782g962 [Gonium pectorale]|eukprot:KXZ41111.1 hypothetical protein GPECTOR_782g962 [Gonium pectorale]